MSFLIFFLFFFILLVCYCLFFSFFNYIYVLIFLDLLVISLILLFLIFVILAENSILLSFSLILLGVGASETALGLLLFLGAFRLQIKNFFIENFIKPV